MDDIRIFGHCENCGAPVTDECDEYYITGDGRVFCCVECVCDAHDLTKVEV